MNTIYRRGESLPTPQSKLNKINVLVLDGGAKAAELIRAIFAELGLKNVFVANDGYQGVQVMKEVRIHMIFTDWELKLRNKIEEINTVASKKSEEIVPLNGLHFVQSLRKSSHSPNPFIPIVMMMDAANKMEVLKARDAGVNEILLRPIDAEEFCKRLISIIDHPRLFITADTYKGPCRRRAQTSLPPEIPERRFKEIRVIKSMGA